MVVVGRIVRPQGHRGQVVVAPETDFPGRRYARGEVLYAQRNEGIVPLRVSASRPHQGRWVLEFEGLASMDAAETWRDAELRVPESTLPRLDAGAYWVHDLVGCQVVTVGGDLVGTVRKVDLATGIPLLVLDEGSTALIPFVDAICRVVDTDGRRITIDPPEGLIDLNRPKT